MFLRDALLRVGQSSVWDALGSLSGLEAGRLMLELCRLCYHCFQSKAVWGFLGGGWSLGKGMMGWILAFYELLVYIEARHEQ